MKRKFIDGSRKNLDCLKLFFLFFHEYCARSISSGRSHIKELGKLIHILHFFLSHLSTKPNQSLSTSVDMNQCDVFFTLKADGWMMTWYSSTSFYHHTSHNDCVVRESFALFCALNFAIWDLLISSQPTFNNTATHSSRRRYTQHLKAAWHLAQQLFDGCWWLLLAHQCLFIQWLEFCWWRRRCCCWLVRRKSSQPMFENNIPQNNAD